MINKEQEAEILRLFHAEKWRPTTIATQLGLHHSTVQRALSERGVSSEHLRLRRSKTDPYVAFIRSTLDKYPRLTAARLYEMCKERGYDGGASRFREVVAGLRPRPAAEAYMRVTTLPGEQAQCDWAHFGKVTMDNAERKLFAFVMVLSWSRQIFVRFYTGDAMPCFLQGHRDAFAAFTGVPREVLYDNLRSAVLERNGSAIRFNEDLLKLAAYYRFKPVPVGVRKANQKGRVERAIQFIRHSFFAARQWKDLNDLNAQASRWCVEIAGSRKCRDDQTLTVAQAFEKERQLLIALPDDPYPAYERKDVSVGKTPYVRFDLNDYSVPHDRVQRMLTVFATAEAVRIHDGAELIAHHQRCYGRQRQIEKVEHIEALATLKANGRKHRTMDRLQQAAPQTKDLLNRAAERGHNLGRMTQQLDELLQLYGPAELQVAMADALAADSPHAAAVRQALETRRNRNGTRRAIELQFSSEARGTNIVVTPKSLDSYDNLLKRENAE